MDEPQKHHTKQNKPATKRTNIVWIYFSVVLTEGKKIHGDHQEP